MLTIRDRFARAEKKGQTPLPDGPSGAVHNGVSPRFSHRLRSRHKTTGMGLGLVRLLRDSGRADEAKSTLSLLEQGSQGAGEKTDADRQPPAKLRIWVAEVSPLVHLLLASSAILLSVVGMTFANDRRPEL